MEHKNRNLQYQWAIYNNKFLRILFVLGGWPNWGQWWELPTSYSQLIQCMRVHTIDKLGQLLSHHRHPSLVAIRWSADFGGAVSTILDVLWPSTWWVLEPARSLEFSGSYLRLGVGRVLLLLLWLSQEEGLVAAVFGPGSGLEFELDLCTPTGIGFSVPSFIMLL
jgi:hypothetical protein